jgi:AraC-like DNA-binding protein
MNYVELPQGIPTTSGACDLYRWEKPVDKMRMLFTDFDLFLVLDGALKLTWSNGLEARIGPGQFAVVPPYAPVQVERLRRPTNYWFCHFNFRMPPKVIHTRLAEDFAAGGDRVLMPLTFTRQDAPGVYKAFMQLVRLKFGTGKPPWQFESALIRMVGELKLFSGSKSRSPKESNAVQAVPMDPRVAAIIQRINTDPARRWTSEELAADVGISSDRLNVLTRRVTLKSVKQLIIGARFELAFRLLREVAEQRGSIKEISARCGFTSQHFFCRQFKKLFKMTPSEFRDSTLLT